MSAERLSDALKRLGWEIPPAPEPVPPDPGCEPWCRENNGSLNLGTEEIRPIDAPLLSLWEMLKAVRYDYCPCPRGDAAKVRHAEALAEHERKHWARVLERGIRASELPPSFCRYGLDDETERRDVIARLRQYQVAERERNVSLILMGSVGVRKSTWATALLRDDLATGRSGLFLVVDDFLAAAYIASETWRSGHWISGTKTIADATGLSVATVIAVARKLESKRVIRVERMRDECGSIRPNRYTLNRKETMVH